MRGAFHDPRSVRRRTITVLVNSVALAAGLIFVQSAAAEPAPSRSKENFLATLAGGSHRSGPALIGPAHHDPAVSGTSGGAIGALKQALGPVESAAPVLIVHTDTTAAVASVAATANRKRILVRHRFNSLKTLSVEVPKDQLAATVAGLQATPGVSSVQVAIPRQLLGVPNDPALAGHQSGYLNAVTAPAAWARQRGSSSVRIAVVDSGVDVNHPDLAGKIVGRYNALDGSSDVTDDVGHGTFVAGVAAASTNNGIGVAGAGYNSSLLAVKVAQPDGTIYDDDAAAGIIWAADNGARVINLSFGSSTPSSVEQAAVNYATGKGALVVAAAGNSGGQGNPIFYPAAYPNVLAVGATNGNTRAAFSEYGSWVDVAAPGVGLYSTTPRAGSTFFRANYDIGDGTSFSAPLVAGEAALLLGSQQQVSLVDLRTAIVRSAHGFGGLGLGAGRVDFRASLDHLRPVGTPQVTAPASGGTASAVITVAARTTAPKVRFKVDGAWLGVAVAASGGTARARWSTWGLRNGRHLVTAQNCSASGVECLTSVSTVAVTVTNRAPAVTSPRRGATISGSFTMTASSSGGGLAFYVDGVRRGFDGSAPFAVTSTGSALKDGRHRLRVVQCTATGAACAGPSSPEIIFTSKSLRPTFVGISPNPFSPNGDAAKDTATVSFHLPDREITTIAVRNASGTLIRGPVRLGALAAGTHSWVWDGRDNHRRRPADGTYSVELSSYRWSGGVGLHGSAVRAVRLDTTAPAMTRITGANTTFFPRPDGYRDAFTPTVVLAEPGRLTLTIRNANGVVRTVMAGRGSGRQSLKWNGRDQANVLVPAGGYTWSLTTVDSVGNTRTSGGMRVTVSSKSLVTKSVSLVQDGIAATSAGASDTTCAAIDTVDSDFYPRGLWLDDECNDPSQLAAGLYSFTLPVAVQYRSLQVWAYGNTLYGPTRLRGTIENPATGGFDITTGVQVSSHSNGWYALGTLNGATHVAGRAVTAGVFVTTESRYVSDFDIGQVELVVNYTVLQ